MRIGSERAIEPLSQVASDLISITHNKIHKTKIHKTLDKPNSERAIEPLIQALTDPDYSVCKSAALALGNIGNPKPLAPLWQMLLQSEDLDLLSDITTLQSRCKFYNYEIAHNLISITQPIALYFSYAPEDEELKEQLERHLSTLQRQGMITSWSDRQILPGAEVDRVIEEQLNAADVILLLISANSLASDKCYDVEIRKALQRHEAGEAAVIPILLKPVDWQGAALSRLKVFPSNGVPVTSWQNSDEAFLDITEGIRSVIQERIKTRG
ncbi:MAG TPA: TIR domain-containing protein [Allocoleopsis sp.]